MSIDFTPTAGEVHELRNISGAGMMDCKKALIGRNISRRLSWGSLSEATTVAILTHLVAEVFRTDDRLRVAAEELTT